MRPYQRKESLGLAGLTGTRNKSNQFESEYSRLGSNDCRCGGPGGRPGMAPICQTCLATDRYMRGVEFSRLVGISRVGFMPC